MHAEAQHTVPLLTNSDKLVGSLCRRSDNKGVKPEPRTLLSHNSGRDAQSHFPGDANGGTASCHGLKRLQCFYLSVCFWLRVQPCPSYMGTCQGLLDDSECIPISNPHFITSAKSLLLYGVILEPQELEYK